MNFDASVQKSTSVIFLDIDGVLMGDRCSSPLNEKIRNKVKELFEQKEGLNGGFTELEWRIAASHFFSKTAVANLENLIEKVSKVAQVAIVISSAWREDGTVEDLRERMFATCSFSRFIIDKTPDYHYGRNDLSLVSEEKYGFDLSTRGRQIDYWLRENHEKLNIKSFVIFDDVDEEISERYPHHFVEVTYPLSESDIEKADNIMTQFSFSSQNFPSENSVLELIRKKSEERKNNCKTQ
jgi:hypothetical protein